MGGVQDILKGLKQNQANVRFADLCKVCDQYFGKARQSGSSHRIYKTPWQGDPRVNIQNSKGKANIRSSLTARVPFMAIQRHIIGTMK